MRGSVHKKNTARPQPVKSVSIEMSLFYSKTGFSARTASRSAPAGNLTFPGAAHIGALPGGSTTIWLPKEDHAEHLLEPHRNRTCIE
jgi:hypothetical protein